MKISNRKLRTLAFWFLAAMPVLLLLAKDSDLYNTFWIPKCLTLFSVTLPILCLVFIILLQKAWTVNKCWNPITWGLTAFASALCLSTFFSPNRFLSFYGSYWRQMGLVVMIPLIAYGILSMALFDRRKIKQFCWFIAIWGGLYGILGISQRMGHPLIGGGVLYQRATGLQGNPDFFAPTFLFTLFPAVSIAMYSLLKKRYAAMCVLIIVSILQVLAVFGSLTRGTWVALFAGFVLWTLGALIFVFRKNRLKILALLFCVGIVAITGVVIYAKLVPNQRKNLETPMEKLMSIATFKNKKGHLNQRIVLWRDSVEFSWDNIKQGRLFGCGWENFVRPFMPHKSLELAQISKYINYDNPHSNFVGLLTKAGIWGVVSYLMFFAMVLWAAFRFMRRSKNLQMKLICLGATTSVCSYAVNQLTIFGTIVPVALLFIFSGIIATIGFPRFLSRSRAEKPPRKKLFCFEVVLVCLFVFSILGLKNYIVLKKADELYEKGRKAIIRKTTPEPQVDQAIILLREANRLYPQEASYAHELIHGLGMKCVFMMKRKEVKKANELYIECVKLCDKYAASTWTPDILFMNMGIISSQMGYIDNAIRYMEEALKWDKWCYSGHVLTSTFYNIRFCVTHRTQDLMMAFFHAHTAGAKILRYVPYWYSTPLDLTLKYGAELHKYLQHDKLNDHLLMAYSLYIMHYDDPAIKDPVEKILVSPPWKAQMEQAQLYLRFKKTGDAGISHEEKKKKMTEMYDKMLKSEAKNPLKEEYLDKMRKKLNSM